MSYCHAEATYRKAFQELRNGQPQASAELLRQVLAERTGMWGARLHLALALSDTGDYEQAVAILQACAQERSKSHVPHLLLVRVHFDHGRYDASHETAQNCRRLDPQNELARCYEGLVSLAQHNLPEAKELINHRAHAMNSEFQARLLLVCEDYLLQHTPPAQSLQEQLESEWSQKSISAEVPDRAAPWERLAVLVRHPLNPLRRAVALHLRLAERCLRADHLPQAIEEAGAAVELAPKSDEAQELLLQARFLARRYQAVAQQAVKLNAELQESNALVIGVSHYHLGNWAGAVQHLTTAAAVSTDDFLPPYHAGLAELGRGNRLAARVWFQRATARLNPRLSERRLDEMLRVADSLGRPDW